MKTSLLFEIVKELSTRIDRDTEVAADHDILYFIFSEDIDIDISTLNIYYKKYGLVQHDIDPDTGYTRSLKLVL